MFRALSLAAAAPLLLSLPLRAQSPAQLEHTRLAPPGAAIDDRIGAACAIDGDTLLVGAPEHAVAGVATGAVFVYFDAGSGWSLQATLTPGDGVEGDSFGAAVDLEGDVAVVGAPLQATVASAPGAVYVFTRTGASWMQSQKLVHAASESGDRLGTSVSLSGPRLAAGAPFETVSGVGFGAGAVYVFAFGGASWSQEARVLPEDSEGSEYFGSAVALYGDTLAAGSPFDDEGDLAGSGSVYFFTRSGVAWNQQAKVVASDADPADQFGSALALDGDTCLVGAPLDDDVATNAGAAYVFTRSGSTWTEDARLDPFGMQAYDTVGFSLALEGATAFVCGIQDVSNGFGVAWQFLRVGSAWNEVAQLVASDGAADDWFGYSVATSGGRTVVGAHRADAAATDGGAAYLYGQTEQWTQRCFCFGAVAPCGNPYPLGGCRSSQGLGAVIQATGSPSIAAHASDPLVLHVQQGPPNRSCVWLQGAGHSIQDPFRDGNLCVGNPTLRLPGFGCGPAPISTLDASGSLATDDPVQGFAVLAASACQGDDISLQVPISRDYQLWYRDASGPCGTGSNLSNAVRVHWRP